MSALPELDLSRLAPVGLGEVLAEAAGLTRVDRKYLVSHDVAQRLVDTLGDVQVLEVAGRRSTAYRSTYLDTPDLTACRDHLQRRRRRWKVRERVYVEDGLGRIEVKVRDGSGRTVKHLSPLGPRAAADGLVLDGEDLAVVESVLASAGHRVDVRGLRPTMSVTYRRVTLADLGAGTRLTLDVDVVSRLGLRAVRLDPGHVLVETKGGSRPGTADRLLVGLGCRPVALSKYVSAASLLRGDLPDNDVRRLRGRVLHVDPPDVADPATPGDRLAS